MTDGAKREWPAVGLVIAAGVVALTVIAGIWAAAAYFLWQTDVPGDLRLPDLDPEAFFDLNDLREAARYERFGRINFMLSALVLILVLVVYAARGAGLARESAAGRIGTGMLLGMLGLAIVWLAQLPFGIAQLWWNRRHDISRVDYYEWILDNWIALGSEFLFICLAILIVMALAGWLRDRWWILGGPAFVGLALLFAFVFPYLIPGLDPLEDRALAQEARVLAEAQGVPDIEVRVETVHEFTSAPNAEAAGLGPTRRVILWDTLLDGRFSDGEIRVVLAHEFAHHAREHIWKSVGWYALFALPGAYIIARVTRRRGGMYEPAAVPLALLVLVVLQLVALPAQNAISRNLEAEADWVALQTTRDPEAARLLFTNFGITALQQPRPPTWSFLLFDSHPTLIQRIAMAEAWEARQP